jgi:hypothetical protein
MQGFLQSAKARATELAADAEVAAKGLVATVEAAIEAPNAEGLEAVVLPIAHGGPIGLHFTAPSDVPGEPVVVDSIAPGSPIIASHPHVREGSRLVAINMVRRSMALARGYPTALQRGRGKTVLTIAHSAPCSSPQVPIQELPLSAVLQMLQHKEDTHQDFTLTVIPPAGSWLPDTDALLDSASVAFDTARLSASAALEKTRSSAGFVGALDALGLGTGGETRAGAPQPGGAGAAAGAGRPADTGAWAQVSLDGPSRLGSLSDESDATRLRTEPPAVAPQPAPVDYSVYYSSSATDLVQQTTGAAAAATSEPNASTNIGLGGTHDASISAGLDTMFSSSYSGGIGDEVDDVPISRGFMKSGYDVGEQITILSRRNQWRQCVVKQKRPGQLLVRCCAEDGPGLGVDGEREEWLSQASKRIRDYWDGKYLPEPPAVSTGTTAGAGKVAPPVTLGQHGDSVASAGAPPNPQQVDLLGLFAAVPVPAPAPS